MTTKSDSEQSNRGSLDLKAAETVPLDGLNKAQVEELVYVLTAKRLVEALRDPEKATPQVLAQALRFCSDNKITGLDLPGSPGAEVAEAWKGKAPFKITG